jgi:hypothetical protein
MYVISFQTQIIQSLKRNRIQSNQLLIGLLNKAAVG